MNNLIFTIALVFAANVASAHFTSKSDTVIVKGNNAEVIKSDNDGTNVRVGGNILVIRKDKNGNSEISVLGKNRKYRKNRFHGHWQGVEIGANFFMDDEGNTLNNTNWGVRIPRSLELNLNLTQASFGFTRNWGLVSGVGLTFNDYHFSEDVTIDKLENGKVEFIPLTAESHPGLKKTKFSIGYVTVPILMEVNSSRGYLSFGVEGGLNFTSHTKVKFSDGKQKDRGSFNVKPFRCSAVVRIGIGEIKLFAKYSMTSLFEDAAGQKVHPFSIGFSFN